MSIHTSHVDIIKRLKRAEGHLKTIISMMEAERACLEVAQQLQAVESAVANAKRALIHDHVDHCLDHAMQSDGKEAADAMREFKEITKYL